MSDPEQGTGSGASASAARVLVVEDEESLRALACHWLTQLGYAPTPAASAGEALRRLEGAAFDVLFTDIAMPGSMDGIALATRVKKERPGVRILLASAYGANLLVDHELPGDFLNKPYTKDGLAAAFTELLKST